MRNNYIYESYTNPYANTDNYSTKKDQFENSPSGPQISPYKTFNGFNSLGYLNSSTQKTPFTTTNYPSTSSSYNYSKNYPETQNIYELNRAKFRSPTSSASSSTVLHITPTKDLNIYSTPSQNNKQRDISQPSAFQDQTPPKNYKPSESHSGSFYSPNKMTTNYDTPKELDQGINRPLFYNSDSKRLVPTKSNSTQDYIMRDEIRNEGRSSIKSTVSAFEDGPKVSSRTNLPSQHEIISSRLKPMVSTIDQDRKDGIRRFIIPTTIDKNDYSFSSIKLKDSNSPQSFSNIYQDINTVHKIFQDRYKANNFVSPSRSQVLDATINHSPSREFGSYEYFRNKHMPSVNLFDPKAPPEQDKRTVIDNSRSSKPIKVEYPKPRERSISPTDFGVDEEVTENDDTRPKPNNSERPSVEHPKYSLSEKLGNYTKKQINTSSKPKLSNSASKQNEPDISDNKVLITEEPISKREKVINSERGRSSSFDRKSSSNNKGMSPLREIYESTKNFVNRMIYKDRIKCDCTPNLLHDNETCSRAKNWLFTKFKPTELDYLKKTYNQVLASEEIDPKCSRQIALDIPRTFPTHKLFMRESEGYP